MDVEERIVEQEIKAQTTKDEEQWKLTREMFDQLESRQARTESLLTELVSSRQPPPELESPTEPELPAAETLTILEPPPAPAATGKKKKGTARRFSLKRAK